MAKKGKGKGDDSAADSNENEIKTPEFRAMYVGLPGQDEKYQVAACFDDESDDMNALAKRALRRKFGDDADPADYKMPWNNGNRRAKKSGIDYYKGRVYCNMGALGPVPLIGADGKAMSEQAAKQAFYSGCYCRALIKARAFESSENDGVSFDLLALQKIRDGDSIAGGGVTVEHAASAFDDGEVKAAKEKSGKGKGKGEDKGDKKKGKSKK